MKLIVTKLITHQKNFCHLFSPDEFAASGDELGERLASPQTQSLSEETKRLVAFVDTFLIVCCGLKRKRQNGFQRDVRNKIF